MKKLYSAVRYLYKSFGRTVTYESLSESKQVVQLSGLERQVIPPAIYLEKHLPRILGVTEFDTLESEHQKLLTPTLEHTPTLMIPFGKASVFEAGVLSNKSKLIPRKLPSLMRDNKEAHQPTQLDSALLVDSDFSSRFFGHWLRDEMSASLIATNEMPAIALHTANYLHATGYIDMLKPSVIYGFRGKVSNLNLLIDYSQGSHKQARYAQLRERLELLGFQDNPFTGVYIARGKSGAKRSLKNEEALIEHLSNLGFDIIFPEKMQPKDIVARLWNTPLVITVEGSAIAHTLLPMAKNSGVLVLQPPYRVCHTYRGILNAKGHAYGCYVCMPDNDDINSFYIDNFDDLDKLIDSMRNTIAAK